MTAEEHTLPLKEIGKHPSLSEKLAYMHDIARLRFGAIDRIAIAKYDKNRDSLRTYVASTDGENPLVSYEALLSNVPSLKKLADSRETRVINDLQIFADHTSQHASRISECGFQSSYTVPLFDDDDQFIGMLFFNSYSNNAFNTANLTYLDLLAQLVSVLLATELNQIATLLGAVKTATQFTRHRDPETGLHLERMAHFSRLIARRLTSTHPINDEFVDDIFRYAPLHDVGKITIPDSVLLKPGRLNPEEWEIMKTHTTAGRNIIDAMLQNFRFDHIKNIGMIHNIVAFHHESFDGRGYPEQLAGTDIPLEARIIAVADVFDALTSERPYKRLWSNDEAYIELGQLSSVKLDPDCVAALLGAKQEVVEIQKGFSDCF